MEGILNPSLESIAFVKIAETLWRQKDVWYLVSKFKLSPSFSPNNLKGWQEIQVKIVAENIPKLPLPERLKTKLPEFIKAAGLRIFAWLVFHRKHFCIMKPPNELYWAPWPGMKPNTFDGHHIDSRGHKYQFSSSAYNEASTKLFLQNLASDERQVFVEIVSEMKHEYSPEDLSRHCDLKYRCLSDDDFDDPDDYDSKYDDPNVYARKCRDLLCFLLSGRTQDGLAKDFKCRPHLILRCLLNWPWQDYFILTAEWMWTFLPEEDFDCILWNIYIRVIRDYKDYNYQELFGMFWQQSSNAYKKYVINALLTDDILLWMLGSAEDKENLSLILKYATVKEKETIIFSQAGFISHFLNRSKRDIVKFFIQECISSESVMLKFKWELRGKILDGRCQDFYELMDDLIMNCYKKESVTDDARNRCITDDARKEK